MPHEPGHTDDKGEHRAMLPEDAPTRQIDIAEGAEIVTSDDDTIGTVKEVQGGYFKVNAHMQTDYWLQRQFIISNADGKVTMAFKKDDLGEYKVDDLPDAAVAQGQDGEARERGGATGFQEEYIGGAERNPEGGTGTNAASETIRAAESPSRGEVAP